LVTIYLNSAENLLAEIRLAFINQDASKFSLASHSLKSTSASIGADKLSQTPKPQNPKTPKPLIIENTKSNGEEQNSASNNQ